MEKPRASRLSRDERREQILDSAADFILQNGLSQCSLEAVAVHARISKALIYRHFSAVDDLLKALLEREYKAVQADLAAGDVNGFSGKIHQGLGRIFDYCGENHRVVQVLLNDPGVARLLGAQATPDKAQVFRTYATHAAGTYGLAPPTAAMAAYLMLNAASGSGAIMDQLGLEPDEAAEIWATFCLAGWAALAARFGGERVADAAAIPA